MWMDIIFDARPVPVHLHDLLNAPWREWPVSPRFKKVPIVRVSFQMTFQHKAERSREQDVAALAALAAFDEDLVPVQIDVPDLDAHEFTHPHRSIEEKLEHDLMLDITAVLNDVE